MPNIIDANGLQTATQQELVEFYTNALRGIYGPDINLEQSTPDGQLMMLIAQATLDIEDLLTQIYNSFDPDNAIGKVLDQRVAINGIQRQAGTFTVTNVSITVNQALTLYGEDQNSSPQYTVADNVGNQFVLMTTQVIASPGVYSLAFRALVPGAVQTSPNTIQVPVTIVLGVTSINNPSTATSIGINEESDVDLKIRRQRSVSLSSQGYLAGLLAALLNISGVTFAQVYENVTGSTDGDGIPSHSIWVIVAGTGSTSQIAQAIYNKRNAGCGMKGTQTYSISQPDGSLFTIRWDNVETENLFIKFTATSLNGVNPPNIAAIIAGLPALFVPGVYQQVNVNALAAAVQQIDPDTLVTNAGFSTSSGGSYTNTLTPSAKNKQFSLSTSNIIIIPIIITPVSATAEDTDEIEFTAVGGYGAYTWSLFTNVSGATIDSVTGLYTAGPTPGTDVVRVTDALSNTKDANVVVS